MSSLATAAISKEKNIVNAFLSFVNKSASQFHAVEEASIQLKAAGFTQISERSDSDWKVKPGGKYFFTRNQTSIAAFTVGQKWKPTSGFTIIGAHTDSPVLKVKPVSKAGAVGMQQVGVETYGGGLWNTWFDRDLSVAGRVIVDNKDGSFTSRLVRIDRSILRIPNLAIHLNRDVNSAGFAPNTQTHVLPVLASAVKAALVDVPTPKVAESKESTPGSVPEPIGEHNPLLLTLVAEELKVDVAQLREFELCLYDTQPAALSGALNEFICARGLDNLLMSFISLRSLIDSSSDKHLADQEQVHMVALFDNEEIGSASLMGAASAFMPQVLRRINGGSEGYDTAIANSLLVSADMAHAVHPNYVDKHEACHRPHMHKGLVLKSNANQRYATSSVTSFLVSEIARKHNIPLQKFVVRNDTGCGSTIGPILASQLAMRTVDVGVPQWAMHSIRETCGTADLLSTYELFNAIFADFAALDKKVTIDM